VPGRIVSSAKEARSTEDKKREAIAKKIGFDAYGMGHDMPDPVAHAINCMLDHIHTMDSRLEEMCGAIKGLGAEIGDLQMPQLDPCEISSAVSDEDGGQREQQEVTKTHTEASINQEVMDESGGEGEGEK
jgi:serine O-acetyltransferase